MKKVAVIGGGITGLTAAFQLRQNGLNPLVFESRARPGGSVQTESIDGYLIESGPNSLQDHPAEVGRLISALGLKDERTEAGPDAKNRYIVRDGRLLAIPSSPPAVLRSPILSARGKLRALREPFIPRSPDDADESLADFVRRRLGEEVLDFLVNPFVAGIYAGDPKRLSVKYGLPKLFTLEQEHGSLLRGALAAGKKRKAQQKTQKRTGLISFKQGLGTVTMRLGEILSGNLYLETTVESVTRVEGGWQIIASRYGRRLRDTYDAVIFALPAVALAKIDLRTETDDTDPSLQSLREIQHPPVATVSLGFNREQVRHPLDGFGMLFPEKEHCQTLGTLFPSTLFPGRAPEGNVLLTSFVGGARQPEAAKVSEEELVQNVLADLRPLLGIAGDPVFTFTAFWPHAIPQYEVGHGRFLETITRFEESHRGLFIAGTARDGISLGQCIASGFRHADRAQDYVKSIPASA